MERQPWTVADVLERLPARAGGPLPAPMYFGLPRDDRRRVVLAVEEMARHMTDEGAQLQWGLGSAGYTLAGHGFACGETDVPSLLEGLRPGVAVVQDEREWRGRTAGRGGEGPATFRRAEALRSRADVFVGTVLKDAQQQPDFHRKSADSIGCHFWVCYYHPAIVCRLAPYVRSRHIIRAYHTVDADAVPPYSPDGRAGCLLSGAVSDAYPLRQRLFAAADSLPEATALRHPGYARPGCRTPEYLRTLSRHKVAVCTASRFGYALRKVIESVACGCVCVTDLPADEVLPEIDPALVRVHNDATAAEVGEVCRRELESYDPERAEHFARLALAYYDFRAAGARLADDIEGLRRRYP